MRISLLSKEGFKVYSLELTEISRALRAKAKDSPVLYLWFSVIMATRLTVFEMDASFPLDMEQIFFAVFFLFLLKASADIHRYFITSDRMEYLFASPLSRLSIPLGVFMVIFWTNLGLWTLFSSTYILILSLYSVPIVYPWLFLNFTMAVMLSSVLGTGMAIHYFSPKRWLMVFPVFFISALWYFHDARQTGFILLSSIPYLIFALYVSPNSFGYIVRKERKDAIAYTRAVRDAVGAMRWKEMTVLWRDRLVTSFLVTSVSVGIVSGYLAVHTDPNIFPPEARVMVIPNLPFIFLFLGIFILASYLFVFPALNTFLAEEKTLWILKNLPLSGRDIIYGKLGGLVLPLITALAFPFYFAIFTGMGRIFLSFAVLLLAFFLSLAVSLPFGIRYAGKRSDVLLLYTVSILIFTVLSIGAYLMKKSAEMGFLGILVSILILDWSAFLLYLSVEFSGKMMDRKWI